MNSLCCLQTVPRAAQGRGAFTQGQGLPLLTLRSSVLGVAPRLRPRKGKKDGAAGALASLYDCRPLSGACVSDGSVIV